VVLFLFGLVGFGLVLVFRSRLRSRRRPATGRDVADAALLSAPPLVQPAPHGVDPETGRRAGGAL
jgi:hypothetical protein